MSKFETDFKRKVKSKYSFQKSLSGFYRSRKPKQFGFVPRFYEEDDEDDFKIALAQAKLGAQEGNYESRIRSSYVRDTKTKSKRSMLRLVVIAIALALIAYKFLLQ